MQKRGHLLGWVAGHMDSMDGSMDGCLAGLVA